ncbi:hypothetical protein CDD80_7397 [Ophiocordyceps camponoti-rufipedis]|uniref:F-box domain-containing protein n=1 Tax=Ophiocordyceps camponoti-rufipedis TaxID=2004952 RepID=A0A2C5ZFA1_9HYPO|nr:hypothetical protein CDD80_7397 [Ophiocordyceps camponoti-rufipedis]
MSDNEDAASSEEPSRYDLQIRLDCDRLRRNAQAHGLDDEEAETLAQMAIQQIRLVHDRNGRPPTVMEVATAIKRQASDEADSEEEAEELSLLDSALELVREMSYEELCEFLSLVQESPTRIRPCVGNLFLTMDNDDEDLVEIDGQRFEFLEDGLEDFFEDEPYGEKHWADRRERGHTLGFRHFGADLISALCHDVELAVEIAKHLGPRDILRLYSVNKAFRRSLDSHMLSSIRQIIGYSAPESGRIFPFNIYRQALVVDPSGRTQDGTTRGKGQTPVEAEEQADDDGDVIMNEDEQPHHPQPQQQQQVRSIPGLKYLQLVLGRDRCCRDILAILSRHGLRHPPGTHGSLLRLWLFLDMPTTRQRRALLRNQALWTDEDLYRAQMFLIKLAMLFNDPVFGPLEHDMPNLILGHRRGLFFLWQVLTRRALLTPYEILEAKVRYDFKLPASVQVRLHDRQRTATVDIFGVPLRHVGKGHLEGWGKGREHLMRPDELIPLEAVFRGLALDEHLVHMMCWGNFDWDTGENLVPTADEMYISDDDRVLAGVDTGSMWQPRHALKKRWNDLTPSQRERITADDDDERLRALAWAADRPLSITSEHARLVTRGVTHLTPALDDEINRGCIIRPPETFCPPSPTSRRQRGHHQPPSPTDTPSVWRDFTNDVFVGLTPGVDGDELLRAETWHNYSQSGDGDVEGPNWDWRTWLRLEGEREAEEAGETDDEDDDGDDEGEYEYEYGYEDEDGDQGEDGGPYYYEHIDAPSDDEGDEELLNDAA